MVILSSYMICEQFWTCLFRSWFHILLKQLYFGIMTLIDFTEPDWIYVPVIVNPESLPCIHIAFSWAFKSSHFCDRNFQCTSKSVLSSAYIFEARVLGSSMVTSVNLRTAWCSYSSWFKNAIQWKKRVFISTNKGTMNIS